MSLHSGLGLCYIYLNSRSWLQFQLNYGISGIAYAGILLHFSSFIIFHLTKLWNICLFTCSVCRSAASYRNLQFSFQVLSSFYSSQRFLRFVFKIQSYICLQYCLFHLQELYEPESLVSNSVYFLSFCIIGIPQYIHMVSVHNTEIMQGTSDSSHVDIFWNLAVFFLTPRIPHQFKQPLKYGAT